MRKLVVFLLGASALLAPTLAMALVGQTSTSVSVAGGNSIYFANQPKYSGVVTLLISNGAAGTSICTGALLANRVSILTAAHCVSHGAGTSGPNSVTAYFPAAGVGPDSIVALDPTSTAVAISRVRVDPLYTGQAVDENDLAVLTLSAAPPASATGYGLYSGSPVGQDYNIAGYGAVSSAGGSAGANLPPGLLRQGTNTFDYALDDPAFQGAFLPGGGIDIFGPAPHGEVLLSDIDDGTAAGDSDCTLAQAAGVSGGRFCGLGTGATEVGTFQGDSGAPEFIDGEIAGVASFGTSFTGPAAGKFGDIDGSAPTEFERNFLLSVPEPATWAMTICGFGLLGAVTRRSRRVTAA